MKESERARLPFNWVFNPSSCHCVYSDDTLNANKLNAKPGGKQLLMHNTVYNGKPQSI